MKKYTLKIKFLGFQRKISYKTLVVLLITIFIPSIFFLEYTLLQPEPAYANDCVWTGLVDNFASTPGNWSGCGGVAPTSLDNVTFDSTSDGVIWNINATYSTFTLDTGYNGSIGLFANVQAITFIINSGTLSTGGFTLGFHLGISVGANGTLNNNTGTIQFLASAVDGVLTDNSTGGQNFGTVLSDASSRRLTLTTNITATDVTVASGDTLDLGDSGYKLTLTGSGQVLDINGTLDPGTDSTVEFQCSADCSSDGDSGSPFHNIIINNSTSDISLTQTESWLINNDLTLTSGILNRGTCTIFGCVLTLKGDWTTTGGKTTTVLFGVAFTGSSAQTITATSSTDFSGLSVSNTVNVAAGSEVEATWGLAVNSGGTLDLNGNPATIGHSFTVKSGGTFIADNATTSFSANTGGSFIADNTTGGQDLGNLVLTAASGTAITLTSNIRAQNVQINGPVAIDMATYDLDVDGNLTLNGNLDLGSGNLSLGGDIWVNTADWDRGTGEVVIDGTGTYTNTSTPSFELGDIIIASSTAATTFTFANSATSSYVYIGDTLNLGNSHLHLNTTSTKATTTPLVVDGTFTVSGDSTVEYQTTADATVVSTTYDNLNINGSGQIFTANGALDVNGAMTVTAGTLTMNNNDLSVAGNYTNNATVTHGNNTTTFDGSGAVSLTVGDASAFNNVTFNDSGGGAVFTLADQLNASSTFTVADGTFSANNQSMLLDGDLTIGASGAFTKGTATTTFSGTTPTFTDSAGSQDLGNVVIGGGTTALTLASALITDNLTIGSGDTLTAGGNDVTVSGVYTNSGTYTPGANTTTFDAGSGTIPITSGDSAFNNVTFNDSGGGAVFTLADQLNASSTFTVADGTFSANNQSMLLDGDLTIGASGAFTKGTATTTFSGTTPTFTDSAGSQDLGNVVIGGGTTALTLASALITDNLTIGSGDTLTAGGNDVTVSGVYTNSGTYTPGANTTTFDAGSGTIPITSGDSAFNNVTFNDSGGGAVFTLADQLNASSTLTITGGTLSSGGNNIALDGNWTNNDGYVHATNTVTFTSTNQSINGTTTFYNLTKVVSSADTLNFENGNTQTIVGVLTLNGPPGNLLSLRSAVPGSTWTIDPQGTRSIAFVDIEDSTNSNITAIDCTANCTDSGNNINWNFTATTPSEETSSGGGGGGGGFLVQPPPESASITINSGGPFTSSQTVTLSLFALDAAEMAISNSPTLAGSSFEPYATTKEWLLTEGDSEKMVYAKFKTSAGGESAIVSDTITLDTIPPEPPTIFSPRANEQRTNRELIAAGNAEPNTVVVLTLDENEPTETLANLNGNWSYNFPQLLSAGTHVLKTFGRDLAGNIGKTATTTFTVVSAVVLPPPPDRIPLPPTIPTPDTGTTTAPGTPTTTPPLEPTDPVPPLEPTTTTPIKPIIPDEQDEPLVRLPDLSPIVETIKDGLATLVRPISNFIEQPPRPDIQPVRALAHFFNPPQQRVTIFQSINYTPITRAVQTIGSKMFITTNLVSRTTYNALARLMTPISNFIEQPPRPDIQPVRALARAALTTYNDSTNRLAQVFLNRLVTEEKIEIIQERKLVDTSKPITTTLPDFEDSPFAMVTPFGNIDLTPPPDERAELPPGKRMTLYFKPERPVNSITVTTLFTTSLSIQPYEIKYLFVRPAQAISPAQAKEYVIDEGVYTDPDGDGIWETTIILPVVGGNYAVETVVDYVEGFDDLVTREFLIDPEGYIFRKAGNDEARLADVTVTIYRQDTQTGVFNLWNAGAYDQVNPQITDKTGEYSFLVPAGTYQITAYKEGFKLFESNELVVTRSTPVHLNIELLEVKWYDNLLK